MDDPDNCPSREDLQRMLLGKLPVSDTETIRDHLDRCTACSSALEQCVASDELLEAARQNRGAACTPTKTMDLQIGWVRDADGTRTQAADGTLSGEKGTPESSAEFQNLLGPPQADNEIGRVADFRVLRVLGVGGMAVVFEAEDSRLGRRVALKLMHPAIANTAGAAERFLREARSAAALKHEHVVTIYQIGMHAGMPFIALELLDGETLEQNLVRNGRLSVREIIRIGKEIASGLAAAHAQGLLHRDIKPANIWLERPKSPSGVNTDSEESRDSRSKSNSVWCGDSTNGERTIGKVKILDFGLAKLWADQSGNTYPGMLLGTPGYMPPEQFSGNAVDPRFDLFSLGCVMYRMASGAAPFGGNDLLSVVRALAVEEPVPVRALDPRLPQALSDLISQLVSKSPEQRPPSAQAVVDRLQAIAEELNASGAVAKSATTALPAARASHARRRLTLAKSLVAGLVVLLPIACFHFGPQLLRLATNRGQVVIKVDDPNINVTVKENNIVIQDRPGQTEITLATGEHQLEVTVKQPSGETSFRTDAFTLSRGGRKIIEVREEMKKAVASLAAGPPKSPEHAAPALHRDLKPRGLSDETSSAPIVGEQSHSALADFDRRAAQWTLSLGGTVTVRVRKQPIPVQVLALQALPASPFELTKVDLRKRPLSDFGLEYFRGLPNLVELSLGSTEITDAGLALLQDLPRLQILALDQTRVTAAGLAHLRGLKNLTSLQLENTRVSDAGLADLSGLVALKSLTLTSTKITNAGLSQLGTLKNLHSLGVGWTQVSDSGLASLDPLVDLDGISLRGARVTDAGLAHFRSRTKLKVLFLGYTPITDAGMVHLQGLERLEYLDLEGTRVTDAGLANLQNLKGLRQLRLDRTAVTDAGLAHLAGMTKLNELGLGLTHVTGAGVLQIQELKYLIVLRLNGVTQIRDAAIPRLLHLPHLAILDISGTGVSAKGFAILKSNLPKTVQVTWSEPNDTAARALMAGGVAVDIRVQGAPADRSAKTISELPTDSFKITGASLAGCRRPMTFLEILKKPGVGPVASLDLSGAAFGDSDLSALKEFQNLRRLVLDGTTVGGPGLMHLQKLPVLAELRLGCSTLTDIFLVELASVKKLERLSLAKSNVTDEGARLLAQLTQLKELNLSETKVTAAVVQELKVALPKCKIIPPSVASADLK